MIWILIIISVCSVVYEYPRFKRVKQYRELGLFLFLLAFAMLLSFAETMHWPIPNPLDWITAVYKPMSRVVLSTLE